MINFNEIKIMHGNQMWGEHPYSVHLDNVVKISAIISNNNSRVIRIAEAHDLLEDTNADPNVLEQDIRQSVILLSRNYSQGNLSYIDYIRMIANSDDGDAIIVKLSDAIVNYSLSNKENSSIISRYKRSIPILYKGVYGKNVNWDEINSYSSQLIL